jgi:hypothetical protein
VDLNCGDPVRVEINRDIVQHTAGIVAGRSLAFVCFLADYDAGSAEGGGIY